MRDKKWVENYIELIRKTNWSNKRPVIKKIDYGGELETLKLTSPNIYKTLKKP